MIHTLDDVTLSATATALSATSIKATWVQVQGVTITGTARIGDSNITSTRGATILSAGGSQFLPSHGNANMYDLSTIYVLGTLNDKVSVLYNTF
jgi:hypothetical protein